MEKRKLKDMKKKVRKMSDAQKLRIIEKNTNVFWRINRALIAKNGGLSTSNNIDALPLFNFVPQSMSFANFGAYMANTRTHKRNNV